MTFDYKKEYKDLYQPPATPTFINVDPINYVAVKGKGNPNEKDGAYQQAMQLLYGISFTIKMSPKAGFNLKGYFPYVVPPLEGFWNVSQNGKLFDPSQKDELIWLSCIRLPDFVTPEIFRWAKEEAERKKNISFEKAAFITKHEGFCVQSMHRGPYDEEPKTIDAMQTFANEQGYTFDENKERWHHEIYLSDPRRVAPERLKTVIRIPIREITQA